MNKQWPRVKLGDVLVEQKQRTGAFNANNLPLLGVSNQAGLHRSGMPRISDMSRYFRVEKDWFAYNPMRINVGSIGWAETVNQTGVISPDYVVFSCSERILPRLLFSYLKHRQGLQAVGDATAGSVRERLYFDALAQIEFPLPPLVEQRRIVARIEELAVKIHEARKMRQEAAEEAEALVSRTIAYLLDENAWETKPLAKVLAEPPRNGLSPKPAIESGGRSMLRINAVSSSPTRFVDLSAVKYVEVSDVEAAPFILKNDDVFIVRYNGDINRVAKPAIFKSREASDAVFPDKLMRLRPDHSWMLPDFLVYALNARSVREQVEEIGKTTAGNIGVSGADAASFVVPVPPIAKQRRIVAELDALQSQVDSLKRLQAETAADLDALLPAILDRAFRGEL